LRRLLRFHLMDSMLLQSRQMLLTPFVRLSEGNTQQKEMMLESRALIPLAVEARVCCSEREESVRSGVGSKLLY
jgi:hypothetical protein